MVEDQPLKLSSEGPDTQRLEHHYEDLNLDHQSTGEDKNAPTPGTSDHDHAEHTRGDQDDAHTQKTLNVGGVG